MFTLRLTWQRLPPEALVTNDHSAAMLAAQAWPGMGLAQTSLPNALSAVLVWCENHLDAQTAIALEPLLAMPDAPRIVCFAASVDAAAALQLVRDGVSDVVMQQQSLNPAVQRAHDQDELRRTRCVTLRELDARFSSLTDRETAVLELVIQGQPNKLIASRLGVTERAIEMRRASLMKKLGIQSLGELIERTLRREFLREFLGLPVAVPASNAAATPSPPSVLQATLD